MQKKKHSGEELYGELGHAFNFTQGDLDANRAGFITQRQADSITYLFIGENVINFSMALLFCIFVPIFVQAKLHTPLVTAACGIVFILFFVVAAILMLLRQWRELQADIHNNNIRSFTATAKSIMGRGQHLAFVGELTTHEIRISKRQYDAAKNRGICRVYCTSHSNKLLAVD